MFLYINNIYEEEINDLVLMNNLYDYIYDMVGLIV